MTLALVIATLGASAQNPLSHIHFAAQFGSTNTNKDMRMLSIEAQLGAKLGKLRVFGIVAQDYLLMSQDNTYAKSDYLTGGGLQYDVLSVPLLCDVALTASAKSSVGDADWNHSVYEVGALAKIKSGILKPYIGLAYRHVSSHNPGVCNYNGAVGYIGLSF